MEFHLIIFSLLCTAWAQIIFPDGDSGFCRLPRGGLGRCKNLRQCPEVLRNFSRERPRRCQGSNFNNPTVCCPIKPGPSQINPISSSRVFDISPPAVDFFCGDSNPVQVGGGEPPKCPEGAFCAIYAVPARIVLVKYSVLVGAGEERDIDWVCTGALISHSWVLTAAHCLAARRITYVRLGEYDYEDTFDGADPVTVEVVERIMHPEYRHPIGYHDLALLRLTPEDFSQNGHINPVCLPWGNANKNIVNREVALTGWGATEFGGVGSSLLLEVNITVVPNSVCSRSYSTLPGIDVFYPRGFTEDIMCAINLETGGDACQGDSGGPVTYVNENKQFVLGGLVSKGHGCGNIEFPGIYVNISHPPYLAWIKKVAFS